MMRTSRFGIAAALLVALLVAGCGKSSSSETGDRSGKANVADASLPVTTPAGTEEVDKVKWAVYRDVTSIDPAFAGDYPEQTTVALMCESLMRQEPDGKIVPGLAKTLTYVDPTTLVFDLRPGVKFWDGKPMTAADVVYSIERQRDPKVAGYWGNEIASIKTVEATRPDQVTITLKHPDYLLEGALSFDPGVVIEKAYAEAKGKEYGTPGGGAMCTGPYELKSWDTGGDIEMTRNEGYWDTAVKPLVKEIAIEGVPEESTLTAGLETGEINGSYPLALSTLEQLESSGSVDVYEGRSYTSDAMIVAHLSGVLGDPRVRRALSLALDRPSLVEALYHGAASPSRAIATPGQWGYARDKYEAAWNELPTTNIDVAAAKKLVEEAGATGETIVLATSPELKSIELQATAMSNAAKSIGLKVRLVSTSATNYFSYFTDPSTRKSIDGFFTVYLSNWADPTSLYWGMAIPGHPQDYNEYRNPKVISLLETARRTPSPDRRAELTIEAQKLIMQDMPWIPTVAPRTLLTLSSNLTGAVRSTSYLFAPWADSLGGKG